MEHAGYPHVPGYLYDCPACESRCHCTGDRSSTNCTYPVHVNPNQPEEP